MTATTRPYLPSDKPACMAIFDSNIPDFFDSTERDDLSDFLDKPDGAYFVVEKDGHVTGSGGSVKEDRGQARFTWGMVHRANHGDGLGRMLAEYRLRAIEKSGMFAEAELFTTPKVAPFFAKWGFETVDIEPDGFAPGMDKVQMIKKLDGTG